MFCSFLFFFFFCSKGFSSSKSCTRILFRKIRTLPDFCCYLIIVVVLFRQNYYPQIVDWFPTSRECVCMEFVGWLLVVIDSCCHDKISSPHFYDQFNFENSQFFYDVFLLFAYILFNSPPLICRILLYLSKEFLLIY